MGEDHDVQLAERIRAGDTAAFEALFVEYYSLLLTYLTYSLGAQDVAEDMVQGVFLDLWDRRDRFCPAAGVRAYLYTAARHRFLNHLRGERRASHVLDDYGRSVRVEGPCGAPDPAVTLEHADLEQAVRAAIAALPERARETFALHREQGLSYQEIASVMGVSVNTVKTQISRAMAAIRVAVGPFLAIMVVARW